MSSIDTADMFPWLASQPEDSTGASTRLPNPTTQPSAAALQQAWSLAAASGVVEVGTPANDKNRAAGRRYSGTSSDRIKLGAPPAPDATVTPRTQAAYASLAADLDVAIAGAQQDAADNADAFPPAVTPDIALVLAMPTEQADGVARSYMEEVMRHMQVAQGSLTREFMKMRLVNGHHAVQELQHMSELSCDVQNTLIREQFARTKRAQELAQKALDRTKVLDIINNVTTAVTSAACIVAAGMLPLTAPGVGILLASIAVGALYEGAVDHGPDAMGAIRGAGYGAQAMLIVCGIGGALAAESSFMAFLQGGKAGGNATAHAMALSVIQLIASLAQAGARYSVSTAQVDAQYEVAQIKASHAQGTNWNSSYNTVQNCLAAMSQVHSKTVEQINAMLKSNQQVSMAVLNHLAHR